MWVMAGNLPGFEEASRALFAREDARLKQLVRKWPKDLRTHLEGLIAEARRVEAAADPPLA